MLSLLWAMAEELQVVTDYGEKYCSAVSFSPIVAVGRLRLPLAARNGPYINRREEYQVFFCRIIKVHTCHLPSPHFLLVNKGEQVSTIQREERVREGNGQSLNQLVWELGAGPNKEIVKRECGGLTRGSFSILSPL